MESAALGCRSSIVLKSITGFFAAIETATDTLRHRERVRRRGIELPLELRREIESGLLRVSIGSRTHSRVDLGRTGEMRLQGHGRRGDAGLE